MQMVRRTRGSRSKFGGVAFSLTLSFASAVAGCARQGSLPATSPEVVEPQALEQTAIEQREICVGSSVKSVGDLGDVLYYRASVLPDGKLAVGYFAFFSEERPWGNNWLTWSVLPALAVDMFYTRTMFIAPGLQRAISGKGDVEGFRIVYEQLADGTLSIDHAVADDGSHAPVHLDRADVLAIDPQRPTFYSNVWSHQLGGRGITSKKDLAYLHCYRPGHVRPLPEAVADEYALAGRAPPAHVEALGGRAVGAPFLVEAKSTPTAPPL
jgi:hypothetical protein